MTKTNFAHLLIGDQITEAVAERIEAARRTPTLRCASCLPTEACSRHIAAQLVDLVRQEDLVLMPRDEADAIIHESVRRLSGAGDEQIRTVAAADDFHAAVCTGPGVPAGFTCSHPSHTG